MADIFREILQTPYLWQSLGIIAAIALFISPVLYNGDYKMAIKSVVVLTGYAAFSAMLIVLHLRYVAACDYCCWLRPVIMLVLVGASYAFGLAMGVFIHNISLSNRH